MHGLGIATTYAERARALIGPELLESPSGLVTREAIPTGIQL